MSLFTPSSLQIVNERRGWAYMFQVLENARNYFQLEDYGLSQTTLDQVFLQFASHQHDDEKEREGIFNESPRRGSRMLVTNL